MSSIARSERTEMNNSNLDHISITDKSSKSSKTIMTAAPHCGLTLKIARTGTYSFDYFTAVDVLIGAIDSVKIDRDGSIRITANQHEYVFKYIDSFHTYTDGRMVLNFSPKPNLKTVAKVIEKVT